MGSEQASDRSSIYGAGDQIVERASVAAAAHDLCNHLQVISSALNFIQRAIGQEASSAIEVMLKGARSSVERAGRLSRTMIDADGASVRLPQRVAVAERLSALREAALLVSGPNILIEQFVQDDVPDVSCDAESLDDAILNIIVNAGRAMPRGGRIMISATREPGVGGDLPCAVLRIAESGCGMSPEAAARAFDLGFTTRRRGEGSGLGLAAVAGFARSSGGSVDLESRLGAGTIVIIRLPGLMKQTGEKCRGG